MHRTGLTEESSPELGHHASGAGQDAPEPLDVFWIVGGVGVVLQERDGLHDLHGTGQDAYAKSQRIEGVHELAVEL